MKPLLILHLFAAAACAKGESSDTKSADVVSSAHKEACAAAADLLADVLPVYAAQPRSYLHDIESESALPLLDHGHAPPDAPGLVLRLRPYAMSLDGRELPSTSDTALTDALTDSFRWQYTAPKNVKSPSSAVVYLAADASVTGAELARIIEVVSSTDKLVTIRLVVRTGVTPPSIRTATPAFALLRARLDKLLSADRARKLAVAIEASAGECEEIKSLLAGVSGVSKSSYIADGVAPALRACQCKGVDLDIFPPAMEHLLLPTPRFAWIPVTASQAQEAESVGDLVAATRAQKSRRADR